MAIHKNLALLLSSIAGLFAVAASHAATLTTHYAFLGSNDGQYPYSSLIKEGGAFYGTTGSGGRSYLGTVYKLDPKSGATTTIYSFAGGSDGASPSAALISVGGILYGTTREGGSSNAGTVFKVDPKTRVETIVYAFTGGTDGSYPAAGLIEVGGALFGTAAEGGNPSNNQGTLFKIDLSTGVETTLHEFAGGQDGATPYGTLIEVEGFLYGTTYRGGTSQDGTIFKISPVTGKESTLYSFTGGNDGSLPDCGLLDVGGQLYGTATEGGTGGAGTVFRVDPQTRVETTLYSFTGGADGIYPVAGLIDVGGVLYGTTEASDISSVPGGGTVFSIDLTTGVETTVYGFGGYYSPGPAGYSPEAALVEDDGVLYGTAAFGGLANGGAVFSMTLGGVLRTTHGFTGASANSGSNSSLVDVGGWLLGTAGQAGSLGLGTVYKINRTSWAAKTLHQFALQNDGMAPDAALLDVNGALFGTTSEPAAYGTIFKIDPKTGAETVVYDFADGSSGGNPRAPLIDLGGMLFGTTFGGYEYDYGTIFSFNPSTGTATTLYAFQDRTDGAFPAAGLLNVGGILYGTTSGIMPGPEGNDGTVFRIDPTSGNLTTLYTFTGGGDGRNPVAALVQFGSLLYGTTSGGGTYGGGTVFSIDPVTSAESTIYTFTGGSDGVSPQAALTVAQGTLFGTASRGGPSGAGAIFKLDPTTGIEQTLYAFTGGDDGGSPQAPLLAIGGVLYGTTTTGGAENRGTVFSLVP